MKTFNILFSAAAFLMISFAASPVANAQSCELSKSHGQGFTTVIENVVKDCDTGEYHISLRLEHDGCPGPGCRELSNYAIEAADGTYSNISVSDVVGSFSYGQIETGNLGAQIPFRGIKVDGISGIGDGMAGSFVVNYTLSELQDQRVSAKPGPATLIVEFSKADFEDFLLCAGTGCGGGEVQNQFPAAGPGTLVYEDLWPAKGDFDFNDVVIDYQFTVTSNNNNVVQSIEAYFKLRAFGAGYQNGFGFQLTSGIDNSHINVSGYSLTESYITLNSNGTEAGQSLPTIIVFDNAYNEMQHPGSGIGVNTDPNAPYVTPAEFVIEIDFTGGNYDFTNFSIADFKPFIISDRERGREVHLPGNAPTDLVDMSFFGTLDDDSNPSQNRWYVTENNLPWAINIIESFAYPTEKTSILDAYLKFADWAQSGGTLYQDWFSNPASDYRNSSKIYNQGN